MVGGYDLTKIIGEASSEVANHLIKKHPILKSRKSYLISSLLDMEAMKTAATDIINKGTILADKDIALELSKRIEENPRPYLTTKGKETILREYEKIELPLGVKIRPWYWGKKGAARVKKKFAEKTTKLDNYVNNAVSEFEELKSITEKYGEAVTPKILEPLKELYKLGFAYEAIDIMQQYKDIGAWSAHQMRKTIYKSIKKGKEGVKKELREMISKYLTVILLVLGIGLIIFSPAGPTGFVIAGNKISESYSIAAGFILLVIGLCMLLIRRKKEF